jgi:glycerol kinase
MHRGTTKNDIIRAALEGIALQVTDLATAMKQLLGADLRVLRVDGGAAANGFLMQLQADLLAVSVDRPKDIESTAIGAGLFAGLGVGIYKTLQELAAARTSDCVFKPTTNPGDINAINQMKSGWVKAIKAVQVFSDA